MLLRQLPRLEASCGDEGKSIRRSSSILHSSTPAPVLCTAGVWKKFRCCAAGVGRLTPSPKGAASFRASTSTPWTKRVRARTKTAAEIYASVPVRRLTSKNVLLATCHLVNGSIACLRLPGSFGLPKAAPTLLDQATCTPRCSAGPTRQVRAHAGAGE